MAVITFKQLQTEQSSVLEGHIFTCNTSSGIALLEIQGKFEIPEELQTDTDESLRIIDAINGEKASNESETDISDHSKVIMKPIDGSPAIRVGRLNIQGCYATLQVGTNQLLRGKVEDLDDPFLIVRTRKIESELKAEIIDVIKQRIIFKSRPAPITGSNEI